MVVRTLIDIFFIFSSDLLKLMIRFYKKVLTFFKLDDIITYRKISI